MRIKSIELEWFRGAAEPVALEPNSKSMVVYGDNGSGKSSFVDAVEYVLNNGSIGHLRHEYSGTHQVNAIPNTHKPEGGKTGVSFRFRDDSSFRIDINANGTSKSSGAGSVAIGTWEYKQTVLRQNEVSDFIHDTKGQKYSALLPLFGLHNMEITAENLRKLSKAIETEARLAEKRAQFKHLENARTSAFGTQTEEQIVKIIDGLHTEYCGKKTVFDDPLSLLAEVELAVENRIASYTAENQRHFFIRGMSEVLLEPHIESVHTASVVLAGNIDPFIAEKLAVLQSAGIYVSRVEDMTTVECPACGQTVTVDAFREHVEMEKGRLQVIKGIYDEYKTAIGAVCDSLNLLKSHLDRPELRAWQDALVDPAAVKGLKYLNEANVNALRESFSEADLRAVESEVLPIIVAAQEESKNAPPEVQKLTADSKQLEAAKGVFAAKDLVREIEVGDALVALINSLEEGVRFEIRRQCHSILGSISGDIERMWGILHPDVKIDSVNLSMPPDADKAIDVVLRFHGVNQDSPRLTLSEGYRNSLGLCIFLAMAKRVVDTERPLFLDDVVVSLDRNHRGMVQELLEREFSDRQVIILTHDREWYTELRYQLDGTGRWVFGTLLPYETPEIGIRWSHSTTTFDDARALIATRPDAAGNDARKIMDVDLSMIAERLQIRLPYLRAYKNDMRTAHDFLRRMVADARRCFQKRSGTEYVENADAIDKLSKADQLLQSWGNRASHSFDVVEPEATKLIDACESALASFKCESCTPPSFVWRLIDANAESVQCKCGELRWRYGRA